MATWITRINAISGTDSYGNVWIQCKEPPTEARTKAKCCICGRVGEDMESPWYNATEDEFSCVRHLDFYRSKLDFDVC